MKHAASILAVGFLILSCSVAAAPLPDGAAAYFVAPDGSDDNPGSHAKPFASLQKANTLVEPGDSVFIRGGTYQMSEDAIAHIDGVFAYPILFERSGSRARPIRYQAYKAEVPIFDFGEVRPKKRRVYAFAVTGSWLEFKGITVTGVQVTMQRHTQSVSIYNAGSCNLFEQLTMRNSQAIGFYAVQGAYNLILNCDAYENWDHTSEDGRGGNTDGFGYHPRKSSQVGNLFYGCRAWHNSDDGWDVIRSYAPITVENCWAAYSGINDGRSTGDGNGFKMGGYASMPASRVPVPAPRHIVRACLAVGNKQSGLYANHHTGGCDWTQNTAYRNKSNVNMLSRPPDNGPDCPGYDHLLSHNLSYKSKTADPRHTSLETCTLNGNSFDLQGRSTAQDFISLDEEQLMRSRKTDGSLPDITLMVPKPGSPYEGIGRASYEQKTPEAVKRAWRESIPRARR